MYKIGYQSSIASALKRELLNGYTYAPCNVYTYYLVENATFDLRNHRSRNFSTNPEKAALFGNISQAQETIVKLVSRMTPKHNEEITPFYFNTQTEKTYTLNKAFPVTENVWLEEPPHEFDDDCPF